MILERLTAMIREGERLYGSATGQITLWDDGCAQVQVWHAFPEDECGRKKRAIRYGIGPSVVEAMEACERSRWTRNERQEKQT